MPLEYGVMLLLNDDQLAERLAQNLITAGYHPLILKHPRQALEAASLRDFCAAVVSEDLPEFDGPQLARMLRLRISGLAAIVVTDEARDDGVLDEPLDEPTSSAIQWVYGLSLENIESALAQAVDGPLETRLDSRPADPDSSGVYGLFVG